MTHYRTDGTVADIADLSDDPRVVRFDYTVRADGRRTAANELWYTVGSATQSSPLQASYDFTYDNLGRLTDEVFDHWDNSLDYRDRFAYDPAGNRVEKSRDAGRDGSVDARTAYRFDANDRLIDELAYARASAPESRTTYTYDYTQNTGYSRERFFTGSPSTRPTLTHVYTYDLQGRLFTATVTNYNDAGTASSITRSTYDYGHTGIRVSAINEIDSTADGTFETRTKIEYLVDHHNHTGYQQVIRESHYDVATGKLVKTVDYTFGHDEISQTVVTYNAAGAEVSRDEQWFLHDGKANVRGLLDAASAILTIAGIEQIYFYDAYGSLLNLQASQAATTLLYNGEQFDALTGNQYLRARYYNPASAQFNRLDPFFGNHQDPQSFNKYGYVHGDPVMGRDPTGMALFDDLSIAGIVSHIAFSELVKLVRPTAETGVQLSTLFANLGNTTYGLLKPDVVDRTHRDYFELKPVTHKFRPDLQLVDAAQMGTYDFVLGIGLGYSRGDSAGLLANFPIGTYVPVVITTPDGVYALKFWPADHPMSGGHSGEGFIWYKLNKIMKPPRRIVEPVRVVNRVYDTKPVEIEVWEPHYTPVFNANLQIDSTLVFGAVAIGAGFGSVIAMASFITSIPSMRFG